MSDTTTTDTTQQSGSESGSENTNTNVNVNEKTIPYARFNEVYNDRKQLAEKVTELEARLAPFQELETKHKELEAKYELERTTWSTERSMLRVGLSDPEAMDVARFSYGRIPEAERPEGGIEAWLTEIKADPTKAPKPLAPYFVAPEASSQQQSTQQTQKPNLSHRSNGYDVSAAGMITAEMLKLATEEAKKTRDWTKFFQLRDQMQKQQTKR